MQIELEKERLALELEERRAEDQRRRAETEARIHEQQKKIDSLSHMVINSAVDDTQDKKSRKVNRHRWLPKGTPLHTPKGRLLPGPAGPRHVSTLAHCEYCSPFALLTAPIES